MGKDFNEDFWLRRVGMVSRIIEKSFVYYPFERNKC